MKDVDGNRFTVEEFSRRSKNSVEAVEAATAALIAVADALDAYESIAESGTADEARAAMSVYLGAQATYTERVRAYLK